MFEKKLPAAKIFFLGFMLVSLCTVVSGIPLASIDQIEVKGLISLGNTGAAWLRAAGKEILVSPGYILTRDLRVTAIKHEGVVLYQETGKQYHVITPTVPDKRHHHHSDVLWCMPLSLWKTIRMIGLGYSKDYLCHAETRMEVAPQLHARNVDEMLEKCVTPHHRYWIQDKIIYVSPVHVLNSYWRNYLYQIRRFKSHRLVRWYPALGQKGTIISDGRDISDLLSEIEVKTGVRFRWDKPVPVPIYCSIKDRPWHEILANFLIFNGFSLTPYQNQLWLTRAWQ